METDVLTRKQTILRLDDKLLTKLKYYAAKEEKSLNSYVESVLRADIEHKEGFPHLKPCTEFSPDLEKYVFGILEGKITQEDIDNDDRLAYLLSR